MISSFPPFFPFPAFRFIRWIISTLDESSRLIIISFCLRWQIEKRREWEDINSSKTKSPCVVWTNESSNLFQIYHNCVISWKSTNMVIRFFGHSYSLLGDIREFRCKEIFPIIHGIHKASFIYAKSGTREYDGPLIDVPRWLMSNEGESGRKSAGGWEILKRGLKKC